jgi:hypothetical protein
MMGVGASEVINHAAQTSCIAAPMFEQMVAIHNILNILFLNGLKAE